MSVPDIEPVKTSSGDGINKIFDFGFKINSEGEILVQHTNADGIQKTLALNTDYSVTGVGSKNGGNIIFPLETSAYGILSSEEKLTRSLELPFKQEAEYGKSEGMSFVALENSFDYITRITQILRRKIERCVKVKEGSGVDPAALIDSLELSELNASNSATAAAASQAAATSAATAASTSAAEAAETLTAVSAAQATALSAITAQQSTSVAAVESEGVEQIALATAQAQAAAASATEAATYAQQLQEFSVTYTATIGTTWAGSSAPFSQEVAVPGILASDNAIVGVLKSDTYATALTQIAEYSKIYKAVTAVDKITFYANEPTSSALSVQIKAVR